MRGEIGVSVTPGGVFNFDRMVEGLRKSALGGMWDPAYFNYGIAIHGAINVPLEPASHGCIRVPLKVGEIFHEYIDIGDEVFVWDGIKEPEVLRREPQRRLPAGSGADLQSDRPDYTTTTTTTTVPPTTVARRSGPPTRRRPGTDVSADAGAQTPAPTQPRDDHPAARSRRRPPTTSSTTVAVAPVGRR